MGEPPEFVLPLSRLLETFVDRFPLELVPFRLNPMMFLRGWLARALLRCLMFFDPVGGEVVGPE